MFNVPAKMYIYRWPRHMIQIMDAVGIKGSNFWTAYTLKEHLQSACTFQFSFVKGDTLMREAEGTAIGGPMFCVLWVVWSCGAVCVVSVSVVWPLVGSSVPLVGASLLVHNWQVARPLI